MFILTPLEMSSPPPSTTTTTATHYAHLLYLLGKREEERKQAGREGWRKREEKQIKTHKLISWNELVEVWGTGSGKEKICTTKTRVWKRTWEKFSSSVSVTRSGESFDSSPPALSTKRSRRIAFFFLLSRRRVTQTKLKQDTATNEAYRLLKRHKGDRSVPKAMEADSKKHRFRKGRSATFSIDGFNITIGKNLLGRQSRRKG